MRNEAGDFPSIKDQHGSSRGISETEPSSAVFVSGLAIYVYLFIESRMQQLMRTYITLISGALHDELRVRSRGFS